MAASRDVNLVTGSTVPQQIAAQPAVSPVAPVATSARTPPQPVQIAGITDLRQIRTGALSTTYQAWQTASERTVTVQVIHRRPDQVDQRANPADQQRTLTAQLSGHAAIVPVLETGMTSQTEPYLVTPFYSRGSLAQLMIDHGAVAWREATFLIEAVAVTLAEVHGCGFVHRDLRPSTIMLTDFLLPRVGELGMSLQIGSPTGSSIVFTPSYSPPEAVQPVPADTRVDVYGLGAVLWALLAGRPPFNAPAERIDARTALERGRNNKLEPPTPTTPKPIFDLLRRSMAADPDQRPTNAAAFVTELRRSVSGSEARVTRPNPQLTLGADPPAAAPSPQPARPAQQPAQPARSAQQPVPAAPANAATVTAQHPAVQHIAPVPDPLPSVPGTPRSQMAPQPQATPEFVAEAAPGARYILLLVAVISVAVLGMVIAAVLTGN